MRKLGVSIYPDKSDKADIMEYLKKTSELGFNRIFTCLLSVDGSKEELVNNFLEIHTYAKQLGFEIILDISPRVFKELDINYQDLSFFKRLKADGIRLDLGFTGAEESLMTFNPENLKIEINMSNNTHYVDTIMDFQPYHDNLIGCHNFYPHAYSGLSLEHFNACTTNFKKHGIKSAAFITSQNNNTFGPWPVDQGLPTLEMHRNLPIDVQLKHFIALQTIDSILISNCYPTDEELTKLSQVNLKMLNFNVELTTTNSEIENKIILEELHFNRGDISSNLIRSTQPRVKYRGNDFSIHNAPAIINRGDIIIESSEYGHYAGELQIALEDMVNSGKSNVVGKIVEAELFILDFIKPWQKFCFTKLDD